MALVLSKMGRFYSKHLLLGAFVSEAACKTTISIKVIDKVTRSDRVCMCTQVHCMHAHML